MANDVPEFDGDGAPNSQGAGSSMQGEESKLGDESGEDDEEYGMVHIVDLRKKGRPLGIQLTHYTSPEGT